MRNINKTLMIFIFALSLVGSAYASGLSIKVVNATLDEVKSNQVTFNGRSYKYQLDEDSSLYSYSEFDKPALKSWELKVGKKYYFELISAKENSKESDFKTVRYIALQPLEDEEDYER